MHDSPNYIFSKAQYDGFDTKLLLTGAWFLECEYNIVHKEEAHLVPPPNPEAVGTCLMEVNDNDDDAFEDKANAPLVQPKAQRVRQRHNNEREACVPDKIGGLSEPDLTQASQQTKTLAKSLT